MTEGEGLRARVLHLINGEDYSGAERVQDLLAQHLPQHGYAVDFACVKPGRFASARRCHGARLFEFPMRSRFDLRPLPSVVGLIRREKYALLHVHSPRTMLIGRPASVWAGVPLVYHLHGRDSTDSPLWCLERANAAVERYGLIGAAAVIAVRESLRPHLRGRGVPEHRIHLIRNGVPVVLPMPRREAPVPPWRLGVVGLFRPRKGLEVLLHTLAVLKAQGLAVRLRAVGSFQRAAYERRTRLLAERLGVSELVEWVGFRREVSAELAQMDVLVQPSLTPEGVPMAMLEAMTAGVPVVASRVDGVTEAIRDGIDGVLAEPGDPVSLAGALQRLMEGQLDWDSLRRHAHERQATDFSDRHMASGVAALYDRILAEGAAVGDGARRDSR